MTREVQIYKLSTTLYGKTERRGRLLMILFTFLRIIHLIVRNGHSITHFQGENGKRQTPKVAEFFAICRMNERDSTS